MLHGATEEELYERLGYELIPPELRENTGELEAAREGRLPSWSSSGDLRGDLHTHSTWSTDGKNTIEEMAPRAKRLGPPYLAVTDHSHYLRDGRLEAQWKEIDALKEKLGRFTILQGVEVNIRADGALDMPTSCSPSATGSSPRSTPAFDKDLDRARARGDGEPARRLHRPSDRPQAQPARARRRRLRARRREGARDRDVPRDQLAAGPARPARHARAAAGEAGLKIVISSDAHEISARSNVEFGVGQARRAWLGQDQVLNTRPWPR